MTIPLLESMSDRTWIRVIAHMRISEWMRRFQSPKASLGKLAPAFDPVEQAEGCGFLCTPPGGQKGGWRAAVPGRREIGR